MYRKQNHREGSSRATRLSLQPLSVCVWNFAPGVSTSLNPPPAEIRAVNDELLGNSGNGVSLKSCPPLFVHHVNEAQLDGHYHGSDYLGGDDNDEWKLEA